MFALECWSQTRHGGRLGSLKQVDWSFKNILGYKAWASLTPCLRTPRLILDTMMISSGTHGHPWRREIPSIGSRTCNNYPPTADRCRSSFQQSWEPQTSRISVVKSKHWRQQPRHPCHHAPPPSTTSYPTEFDILLDKNCLLCYWMHIKFKLAAKPLPCKMSIISSFHVRGAEKLAAAG